MPQTLYYNLTIEGNLTQAIDSIYGDLMTIGGINWFWGLMIIGTMMVIYIKTENMMTAGIVGAISLFMLRIYKVVPFEIGKFGIALVFMFGLVIALWKLHKG